MATVKKTKNSRHNVKVYVNNIRKPKTFDTKAQAKSWASKTEFELGKMVDGVSLTHIFRDAFDRYAAEVLSKKKGGQWGIVRLNMLKRFPISN